MIICFIFGGYRSDAEPYWVRSKDSDRIEMHCAAMPVELKEKNFTPA
jgi:hypothetical protein